MGQYPNHGKRQFSEREKRAYSAGCGYGAAQAGKRVQCKTEREKKSFRNGVAAAKYKVSVKKAESKCNKSGGSK